MSWMPFRDENGAYHDHNPNWVTTSYRCSLGHLFSERGRSKCPSCDFGGAEPIVPKKIEKPIPGVTVTIDKRPMGFEAETPDVGKVSIWVGGDDQIYVKNERGQVFRIALTPVQIGNEPQGN